MVPAKVLPLKERLSVPLNLTDEEKQKKIRNLEKKLRQIRELKEKMSNGEELAPAQQQKVATEVSILREIANLRL
ncbi:hypothetical protein G6F68_020673 [Rhizopus microsporus]|nr:hypothetical protein G6F68_020673 [Rhizopus microsporus]